MMTTRSGPRDQSGFMVTVTPPESCKGSTYVGVHGSGARRLVFPRQGTCKGQPAPGDRCDRVEAHEFAADVQAHLVRTVGAIEIGKGLGGCGQPGGEVFDDTGAGSWAFVIHLQDWAYADAALATIAERMSAWDVGSTFGISVDSTMCAVSGSDT
jgi:hypothetical protein